MMGGGKKNRPGRLPNYDYSTAGYYFITFCTRNRDCCLSSITKTIVDEDVGRGAPAPPRVVLKEPGLVLDGFIQNVPEVYPGIIVDKYVIMPNHVHLLIQIAKMEDGGARAPRPTPHILEGSNSHGDLEHPGPPGDGRPGRGVVSQQVEHPPVRLR